MCEVCSSLVFKPQIGSNLLQENCFCEDDHNEKNFESLSEREELLLRSVSLMFPITFFSFVLVSSSFFYPNVDFV